MVMGYFSKEFADDPENQPTISQWRNQLKKWEAYKKNVSQSNSRRSSLAMTNVGRESSSHSSKKGSVVKAETAFKHYSGPSGTLSSAVPVAVEDTAPGLLGNLAVVENAHQSSQQSHGQPTVEDMSEYDADVSSLESLLDDREDFFSSSRAQSPGAAKGKEYSISPTDGFFDYDEKLAKLSLQAGKK
ncbi:MAG: hypothetical protein M1812_006726 [Candelaria pacifica]|nr:MAG: hypothetical protein M1812_006726 [Candelaria pacifica]